MLHDPLRSHRCGRTGGCAGHQEGYVPRLTPPPHSTHLTSSHPPDRHPHPHFHLHTHTAGKRKAKVQEEVPEGEAEGAGKTFHTQYSIDGQRWHNKGRLSVGRMLNVWFEPEEAVWADKAAEELAHSGIFYLRVSQQPSAAYDELSVENTVQVGVSACELVNAAFAEHYQVTFAPHDDEKRTVLGFAPFGSAYSKTRASHLDACTRADDGSAALPNLASRFALMGRPLAHAPVIHDKPPSRTATFGVASSDDGIYAAQNTAAEAARKKAEAEKARRESSGEGGQQEAEEPQEKSFFERYWVCGAHTTATTTHPPSTLLTHTHTHTHTQLYFMMVFLFMKLQGAVPEPEAGGEGGGGGGGGKAKAQ